MLHTLQGVNFFKKMIILFCLLFIISCNAKSKSEADEAKTDQNKDKIFEVNFSTNIDEWHGYCQITLDKTYTSTDSLGNAVAELNTGEKLLVSDFSFGSGIKVIKFSSAEPQYHQIRDFPTDNIECTESNSLQVHVALADVTVYEDDALQKEICKIKKGTSKELGHHDFGFALIEMNNTYSIYEMFMSAFESECHSSTGRYFVKTVSSGFLQLQVIRKLATN